MNNEQRINHIKEKLINVFHPEKLVVTDDSDHHIGHPGAKEGKGHFSIEITAKTFKDKSQIECHRLVYEALGDLMKTDIHAVRIRATAPN